MAAVATMATTMAAVMVTVKAAGAVMVKAMVATTAATAHTTINKQWQLKNGGSSDNKGKDK